MTRPVLIVCGMHRSGTSLAAELCGLLGYEFPADLMEPNVWNARGYFESRSLAKMHDEMLRSLGSSWWDPRPFGEQWQDKPQLVAAWSEGKRLISDLLEGDKPILIKDPRISRFLPLWLHFLEAHNVPHQLLLVLRRPAEVANSLFARDHFPGIIGGMLWWRYVTDVVRVVSHFRTDASVVGYEAMLQQPDQALSVISKWTGKGGGGLDAARGVVNPELKRSVDRCPGFSGSGLEALCETLFEQLLTSAAPGDVEVGLADPQPMLSGLEWWPHVVPLVKKHEDLMKGVRALSRMV